MSIRIAKKPSDVPNTRGAEKSSVPDSTARKYRLWRKGMSASERWVVIGAVVVSVSIPGLLLIWLHLAVRDFLFR